MFESGGDLAAFFTDFATIVTLFPGAANQTTISAIFDASSIGITLSDGLEITESQPQLTARDTDITGLVQGSALQVNNKNYTVSDIRPDGTGVSIVRLNNRS